MISSIILSITTFVYGFSSVLYVSSWIFKRPATRAGRNLCPAGVAGFSAAARAVSGKFDELALGFLELRAIMLDFFLQLLSEKNYILTRHDALGIAWHPWPRDECFVDRLL